MIRERHMLAPLSLIVIAGILMGVRGGLFVRKDSNGIGSPVQELAATWEYRFETPRSVARWQRLNTPSQFAFDEHRVLLIRNRLPSKLPPDAGLFAETYSLFGPFEVYVANELVYAYGHFPSWFSRQFSYISSHRIPIPDNSEGKIITVRFTGKPNELFGPASFPKHGSILEWDQNTFRSELPYAMLRGLIILVGLYHLLVLGSFDFENRRLHRSLGGIALLCGLNMLDSEIMSIAMSQPWLLWYLSQGSLYFLPVVFLSYIQNLIGLSKPNILHRLSRIHFWLAIVLLFSTYSLLILLSSLFWFATSISLLLVLPKLCAFFGKRHHNLGDVAAKWGLGILFSAGAADVLTSSLGMFNLSPIMTTSFHWGMVSFLLFVAYTQTIQAVNDRRELDRHRHKLEAMVENRTLSLKEATEALVQEKEKAEAANRAKSAFLATVSHELRTPLNGIIGFAQILSRTPGIENEVADRIAVIHHSGNHLLGLINEILEISRIESGAGKNDLHYFSLSETLAPILKVFESKAHSKAISFSANWPNTPLPPLIGSPQSIRQIVINLLGNAVKFTDKGFIEFEVSFADDTRLTLSIKDSGPGIPADQHHRIFQPFERIDNTRKDGTGLGLAISKALTEQMSGTITVDSRTGEGTTMLVTIPVVHVNPNHSNHVSQPLREDAIFLGTLNDLTGHLEPDDSPIPWFKPETSPAGDTAQESQAPSIDQFRSELNLILQRDPHWIRSIRFLIGEGDVEGLLEKLSETPTLTPTENDLIPHLKQLAHACQLSDLLRLINDIAEPHSPP